MEKVKLYLVLLILGLFLGNFYICEYFYFDNLDKWWDLKLNIYAFIISLCFITLRIKALGIITFFLDVGVGIALSNLIDRVWFDTTVTTKEDFIMLSVTIIIAIIDYKKHKNKKYVKN